MHVSPGEPSWVRQQSENMHPSGSQMEQIKSALVEVRAHRLLLL